jgi:hypothetical protein
MGYIGLLLNAPYKIDSMVWMMLMMMTFLLFSFFSFLYDLSWLIELKGKMK